MTPTFLTVARQGRNGWKRYLAGISLALGTCLIIVMPCLMITAWHMGLSLTEESSMDFILEGNFYRYLAFLLLGTTSLILGLFLAVEKVQKRPFLSLINPNNSISWQRILQGFSIFLLLRFVAWIVLYLLLPERYIFTFQPSTAFKLLLGFLVIPWSAFCPALFLAYLLQGLGLLVKNPLILAVVWGVLLGGISSINQPGHVGLTGILVLISIALIIIKDNRLELIIGLIAASIFFNLFLGSGDQVSTIPSVFKIIDSASILPGFLYFVFVYGMFYYIFFGRKTRSDRIELRDSDGSR